MNLLYIAGRKLQSITAGYSIGEQGELVSQSKRQPSGVEVAGNVLYQLSDMPEQEETKDTTEYLPPEIREPPPGDIDPKLEVKCKFYTTSETHPIARVAMTKFRASI